MGHTPCNPIDRFIPITGLTNLLTSTNPDAHAGIGVAFDTFKNTDHGARHRDVAVFVSDGKKGREDITSGFDGWCVPALMDD